MATRRSPRKLQRRQVTGDPGLGLFAQVPLECRRLIYKHYFANAVSTIKMIPKNTSDSDRRYRYSYLFQPYDRDLLSVSHSIREEAIPYHQPPELVLNNLDLQNYQMLDVRWDIPRRLRSKATTVVAQIDLSQKRKREPEVAALDRSIEGDYPSSRRLELRMILPGDQVAHWCQNKSFTKRFEAQAWQGMYDQDVLRVFKDWLLKRGWSYLLMHDVGPEGPRCHCESSGFSCKGKRVEVLLDLECWRSSEIEDQGHCKPVKALHFIFDLKSERVVDRYIANRPLTDTVGIWDSFGKHNQRAWQNIEVELTEYPWDDPTHPLY